ncbi:MAG: GH1 family beta-glucosidase [Actinomycetaceae bacterium]|nr:GH1 family beta-glucosidase [Actinomycetaceae bacterium]
MTQFTFSPDFMFGAATASAQIEGASHQDGKTDSIWDTFCRESGRIVDKSDISIACDHYNKMEDDVRLMSELNLQAYRFSLSWPRIRPDDKDFNPKGIDFYSRLIDELLAHNITPWITLYHWDLPQTLQDKGGWANRDTAYRFAEYSSYVYDKLGDRVQHWTTLNEPWCSAFLGYETGVHAPGRQSTKEAIAAAHHLLLAHGLAAEEIRNKATSLQQEVSLGITLNFTSTHPADPDNERDVELARILDGRHNRLFIEPLLRGAYPKDMEQYYEPCGLGKLIQEGDLDIISTPIDVMGINYYTGMDVRATENFDPQNPEAADQVEEVSRGLPVTDMGWEVYPEDFEAMLVRLSEEYAKPAQVPMVITENGAAYVDKPDSNGYVDDTENRLHYIHEHLGAIYRAIERGADIRGYFVWSLLDNFEWSFGYTKRFGIVRVDFETLERIPKASARWFANVAKTGTIKRS